MTYRMIVVVTCALLAGCASAPPLDDLIGFSDPQTCEPNQAFAALLGGLVDQQEANETYVPVLRTPPIPRDFKTQVGTPELTFDGQEYRANLPLLGRWQGLPLRSVTVVGSIESEQGFEILFDADPEQVIAGANRGGFGIPSSGRKYLDDDVLGLNIGVAKHDDGTALFCIPG